MPKIHGNDIMMIMRNTLNMIDHRLIDHGHRVAYMVWKCACYEGTLDSRAIRDLTITAFLHDIGAYKTEEIDKMVEFETEKVFDHSIYGYLFLKYLAPLEDYANMILCHHVPYEKLIQHNISNYKWIQILSIADRFDVAFASNNNTIDETKSTLLARRGTLFSPESLDLFFNADKSLHFLQEIYIDQSTLNFDILSYTPHSNNELRAYLDMVSYSIDFRSQFMVTHTMKTNRISLKIADLLHCSFEDKEKIDLGSILHDLGKVAIPIDILDYPGKLDGKQMSIMRKHVEYTAEILDHLLDDEIIQIAVRHHEKLNGNGYPMGLSSDDLNTNERIVAIADIISALYEQRSYKGALDKTSIIHILKENSQLGSLDPKIISLVIEHYDEIISFVQEECNPMINTYSKMSSMFDDIRDHFYEFMEREC